MSLSTNYVDLVITPASPGALKKSSHHYRRCTVVRRGNRQFINLQLPENVQEMILDAYQQGKAVRIFS